MSPVTPSTTERQKRKSENMVKESMSHLKGSSAVDLLRTLLVRVTAAATGRAAADASMLTAAPEAKLPARPLLLG